MLQIRGIIRSDAEEITRLTDQLGYSIGNETVAAQIESVINHPDHLVFVAVMNGQIVGFIHGCRMLRLTSPTFWEICGLVVSGKHRRQGVGRKLVEHLESEIETDRHTRVRCNVKRSPAHQFYKYLGFAEKKEQKVFEK